MTMGRRLIPAWLIGVGLAAYRNSFGGAFLFDDLPRIVDNRQVHQLWPLWDVIHRSSRPVVQVSLALNYAVGGVNPWGYHAVNLAVHILAGLVLFGIVRRMLESGRMRARYGGEAPWLAMVVAGIWLVHPLQTESVTYIIQRAESLMGLFFLLMLYCGIRANHSPHPRGWCVAAVTACALGMDSKEVMVSAPVLMLVHDRVFIAGSFRDILRRRWGLYAGLAATWIVLGVSLATSRVEKQMVLGPDPTPWRYALTQGGVILHYLRLSVWPHPLVLDYGWPLAESVASAMPGAAIVLALLAGTVLALRREPWVGFWGAWFFLILAPTSSFIPIADAAFEHRMYLPLAAVVVLVVIGGRDLLRLLARRLRASDDVRRGLEVGWVVAAVAATACLGYATSRRNEDYRSELAMWRATVAEQPENPRAHINLGAVLTRQGKAGEAMAQYAEAVRLRPDYAGAQVNLGDALYRQGRNQEAIAHLAEAVRLKPDNGEAHSCLASALVSQGRDQEAIAHFSRAASLDADSSQAYNDLGNALYLEGRIAEAVTHYSEAVRLQPGFARAHHNLGLALLRQGDTLGAIARFSETIRLQPGDARPHNDLGILLYARGRTKESIAQFSEALRLDPTFEGARQNLRDAQTP